VNSLPKTVNRQRRDCDLNPGPSAPESSTLTTRLPSHPLVNNANVYYIHGGIAVSSHSAGTATGTHMQYGITQYYLPPGRGDIPAVTSAEAGTRLSDPEGCKAELT